MSESARDRNKRLMAEALAWKQSTNAAVNRRYKWIKNTNGRAGDGSKTKGSGTGFGMYGWFDKGCCDSCEGTGTGGPASDFSTMGKCSDCYGTGHLHNDGEPCNVA